MIASIIARQYGGGDEVKLSLRIATPTMKNAVALNVSVDKDRWLEINKSMKLYSKAYRRGSVIEVESGLKSQLWDIIRIVEAQYQTGALTLERVKAIVANIMNTIFFITTPYFIFICFSIHSSHSSHCSWNQKCQVA